MYSRHIRPKWESQRLIKVSQRDTMDLSSSCRGILQGCPSRNENLRMPYVTWKSRSRSLMNDYIQVVVQSYVAMPDLINIWYGDPISIC